MDHSQRSGSNDSSSAPSASSTSMPNVLFREIHKNAFLKRHSSDRRTGFPRKSERVWVVFCVHDDVEPFLEIYPDQKVALTHKPDWFASLSNVLHVSPTICGHEDEFEFAVTLSFQVVRLAAPSWESMMEWVETIRNKLRELKVLCPKENVYSKMPEPKQPLLPTRDPNSPLPLPPEGPSTLLPGVELVHLQSRNCPSSVDNAESARHQRDAPSRNNVVLDRHINKRKINERDKRQAPEQQQSSEMPSSSSTTSENQQLNGEEVSHVSVNSGALLPKSKHKAKRTASTPQPAPSTSQVSSGRNVTVIEVSATGKENHSFSELTSEHEENISDDEVADDVFHAPSTCPKVEVKTNKTNTTEDEEAHYEHVFLPTIPVHKPQLPQPCVITTKCPNVSAIKIGKPHSTSVLIKGNHATINSSPSDTVAGPSCSNPISNVQDVQVVGPACVNLARNSTSDPTSDSPGSLQDQIQTKMEKVNISVLGSKVSSRSSKPSGISIAIQPTGTNGNLNVIEGKKFSVDGHVEQRPVNADEDAGATSNSPAYSQVKKVPKIKIKCEKQDRIPGSSESPVLSIRSEIHGESSHRSENLSDSSRNHFRSEKSHNRVAQPQPSSANKNVVPVTVNVRKEPSRNAERCKPSSSATNSEAKVEVAVRPQLSASPHGMDNGKPNGSKKDAHNGSNSNPEVEPMPATVQPTVGVISVEDIPLIGGHQRRRRRSSSSDAGPVTTAASSRVIGGADRIRINIPQTSAILTREDHRGESETTAAITDQIVHIHPAPKSSRLTLREQQVLQLKKEMLHPGGVRLQLRRKDCTGSIALVDVLNGVWVAGWKQKEHPLLYNALHIGDQLISVSDMVVRTSADAHKLIRSSTSLYVEFIIRRVPFGNVFALQRSSEGQNLGIVQEGNTAEIREVLPNSVAARQGLTSKTPTCDGLSLTTWFLTEINGRPLNLFFKDTEVKDRLNAVGKEISILVQPNDFIKQIKKQLKNLRGYKDYIVQ